MKKDTSDKPQLFLTNWQGFTEFDLSSINVENEPGIDSITFLSIEALPGKTKWQLMLKKQVHSIIRSIENFNCYAKSLYDVDYDVFASGEEIEQRAAILSEVFFVWPSNSLNEEFKNRSQEGLSEIDIRVYQNHYEMVHDSLTDDYVSHLTVLFDTDVAGDDYLLLLSLMLIHEAIRLDGEISIIAAREAMEIYYLSILRLHIQIDSKRRSSEESNPPKTISDFRHEIDRLTSEHAKKLAITYSNENDYESRLDITKKIMEDVNDYAQTTLKRKSPYGRDSIYKWVREVVKETIH